MAVATTNALAPLTDLSLQREEFNGAILRYPLSIGQSKAPAILFNIHRPEYKTDGGGVDMSVDTHIALYMTQGLAMTDSMDYQDRSSGMAGSLMAAGFDIKSDTTLQDVKDISKAFSGSDAGKAVGLGAAFKFFGAAGGLAAYGLSGYLDHETKDHQTVLKQNPFITFKGVGLREWSFTWSFIPESEAESKVAKGIIRTFRKAMYPLEHKYTLGFPDVFQIEYINAEFPLMPEVALTSCAVEYNKDSNSFFMQNNEPVRMDMTLTFKELQSMSKKHITQGY